VEIMLPQSEITLNATATDKDGIITSYQWSVLSETSATITSPNSAETTITGLQEGIYQFAITVTDDRSATSSDTVEVTVQAAPIVENKEPRLNYAYYEGKWSNLPDFNQITAVESGTVANFDISKRQQDEYFGFAFTGYIDIQATGTYRFYTTSDDGSALYIDGKKVVDNDGRHSRQERSGSVRLSKGKHPIQVVFFEHTGQEILEVHYQGPGIDKMLIPDEILFLEGDPEPDVPVIEEDNLIYVNFHRQGRDEAEGWNNVDRSEKSLLLENADGTLSYAMLKLETNWGGDNYKGFTTGNNSGKYADAVTRSYFWTQEREIITLEGLSTDRQYSFTFFASSMFGGNRTTIYTIGDQEVTMNASYNEENTVTIENVRPVADGTIEIEVSRATGATYGFLGSMIIRSEQPEEVPSTPMVNLFQVNFHRQGRDEAEGWNNVDRTTESLLLESTDGTPSAITLKLRTNWGGDNYKGFVTGDDSGEYPDAVTRSYFWTQEREIITLEGASTDKLYNLTFFASSMFSGNRTAIYKIGDQEVSMNASYNEDEMVTIENVRPAADGTIQIEVSRAVGAIYGFLGAMIIESEPVSKTPAALAARKESPKKKGTELTAEVEEVIPIMEQFEINIYPNPSIGLIHIKTEQAGAYQVRNLQGHLIEQGQLSEYQETSVDFSELPKGIYLVQTQSSIGWNTQRVVIQ
ncbi:MAG: PA14 domain-containing protein, partial [Bacteroidota bacterium]